MDKKFRGSFTLGVETMNSERQVKETWTPGTYSRLPFNVNVMLNFSVVMVAETRQLSNAKVFFHLAIGRRLNLLQLK